MEEDVSAGNGGVGADTGRERNSLTGEGDARVAL